MAEIKHPILVLNPEDDLWEETPRIKPLLKQRGSKFIDLPPGATYHVKPGQVHRFGAIPLYPRNTITRIIEVSTNHLDDVVRLADDFNR